MMYFLIEKFGLINGWALGALIVLLRYATFSGMLFLIFYILWKQAFAKLKIQPKIPKGRRIWHEVQYSISTAMVFACVGVGIYFLKQMGITKTYTTISEYGWFYFVLSFFLLTILHDTYFYWIHRLMHHARLFPFLHKVHHVSNNPTPFAALSFHPFEALIEIGIVPIVTIMIPFHPIVLFLFATWSLFFNVMGHLGYELFPKGFIYHPIGRWINTSTHHNMHHARSNCNYGLYYNFWDTIMKTNAPDYKQVYDRITSNDEVNDYNIKTNHL